MNCLVSLNADAQTLADKYGMAVKEIRLIGKDGKLSALIKPGYAPKGLLTMDFTKMPLNKDFSAFTEQYPDTPAGSQDHLPQWLRRFPVLPGRDSG